MKIIHFIFCMLVLVSCASPKETSYTASTPAGPVVRSFLGIPLSDSIDFIRWRLSFTDNSYQLSCNYGIGKPNTNGFFNGGKTINISGSLGKQENTYLLQNGDKTLELAELNADLLHILDAGKNLLVGNGGWSYTINSTKPSVTNVINSKYVEPILKDSMVFEGRTPCGIPGVVAPGKQCYKLKWRVILYADADSSQPTTFNIPGSPWYEEGGRKGTWKIIKGPGRRITYHLEDNKGNTFYLLKTGGDILLFTDANGNLLVGDEDFSYTLNRK